MGDTCAEHGMICSKIGEIHALLIKLDASITSHILEADRAGGVRDRVAALEAIATANAKSISTIKQGYWKTCLVSGVVGGLLARLAPDLIWKVLEQVLKVVRV